MQCRVCEGAISGRARYCGDCGARVSRQPPVFVPRVRPVAGRMERHRRTLGVLYCVSGALRVFAAFVVVSFLRWRFGLETEWVAWFTPVVEGLMATLAVLSVAAGYGLLTGRSWARTMGLVAGAVSLLHPPLGTALGVYALWVLGAG